MDQPKQGIYPWNQLADDTYWSLGGLYPKRKFKWFNRKKIGILKKDWMFIKTGVFIIPKKEDDGST